MHDMTQSASTVGGVTSDNTSALLQDPEQLVVPVEFEAGAVKRLLPQVLPPGVTALEARSRDALVEVAHQRIIALEAYRVRGFKSAVVGTCLREGAAARLCSAAEALPEGFGLAVLDAWRPLALQRELFDAAYSACLPPGFVAEPSEDPALPPAHLTGGAVDVTLTWRGVALALGTQFDEFSPTASPTWFERQPGRVRELRRLLIAVMANAGFVVDAQEWWHFEYGTLRWAAVCNEPVLYGGVVTEPR